MWFLYYWYNGKSIFIRFSQQSIDVDSLKRYQKFNNSTIILFNKVRMTWCWSIIIPIMYVLQLLGTMVRYPFYYDILVVASILGGNIFTVCYCSNAWFENDKTEYIIIIIRRKKSFLKKNDMLISIYNRLYKSSKNGIW